MQLYSSGNSSTPTFNATLSSSGDGAANAVPEAVHHPSAAVPEPSTAEATSALGNRGEIGIAVIAALLFLLTAVVVVVRNKRPLCRHPRVTVNFELHTHQAALGGSGLGAMDWFRGTDASIERGTESFCGSWEHPDVAAKRIAVDQLSIDALIARGKSSEVYRGRFARRFVAIKKPTPQWLANLRHIDAFFCEVRLLSSLTHPNIVEFLGVAWRSLLEVYLVSEFMDGGDLRSLLAQFDKLERRPIGFDRDKMFLAKQIAAALAYLHAQSPRKLVHMAVRSKNILITNNWTAKLIDFRGASVEKYIYDLPPSARSIWSAPEVIRGEKVDEKADVFSFGVVLSELDTHRLPYAHLTAVEGANPTKDKSLLRRIASGNASLLFSSLEVHPRHVRDNNHSTVSIMSASSVVASPVVQVEMAKLATACVNPDPTERPTSVQVLREIQALARMFEIEEATL